MTIVYNVYNSQPSWASQTYALGAVVATGGNAYKCIVPGSSTSAPTGTFGNINNGGVAVWQWLSAIDFTSLSAFQTGIPTTWTDNFDVRLWNTNGAYTTTTGTPLLTLTGHTTAGFTMTIRPAPGQSFRDSLRDNNFPLAYDQTKGVAWLLPASGAGNTVYVNVVDPGVTIQGIQYKDPNSGSASIPLDASGDNFTWADGLVDTFSQPSANGGFVIEAATVHWNILNSVFIDRQTVGANAGQMIQNNNGGATTAKVINCTFISTTTNTTTVAIVLFNNNTGGVTVRNCAFFGWTANGPPSNLNGFAAGVNVDHCVMDYTFAAPNFTDQGGNLYTKTAANQFFSAFTDLRMKKTADGYHTGVADATDIATADDIAGRGRGTGAWSMGAWEPGFDTPNSLATPVFVRQQQPTHPLPSLLSRFPAPVQPVVAVTRTVFVRQEQPQGHPLPRMVQGMPGRATKQPNIDYLFGRQQQPDHPWPRFQAGIQGPSVRAPIADWVMGRQEQPPQVRPVMLQGLISRTRAPTIDWFMGRQQQPDHPAPRMQPGVQGPDVRPPVADFVLGRQQFPSHPPPFMASGPYGQLVTPPITSSIVVRLQVPAHPLPVLSAGVQGPDAAQPGVVGSVLVRQEQPRHPLPVTWPGRWPDPPLAPYPLGPAILPRPPEVATAQQPLMVSGVQGPDVRVPVADRAIVGQQQPPWLQPILTSGPYGQNVRPPTSDTILVRQQQPDHPLPQLGAGVQGPSVRSPTSDTILVRQQQPDHPYPTVRAGVQGPNVMVRVLDSLFTVQQLPGHPGPILLPSIQGPNVLTKVSDGVMVRQQQPDHPWPTLRSGVQGPNVAPPGQVLGILVRQEQPAQIFPRLAAGVQSTTFLPAPVRLLLTRQYQPDHPLPVLRSGVTVDRPFVVGRTVVLRANL